MAKPDTNDQIWVTVSATINLGNFENIKIEAGLSRTLTEEDRPFILIKSTTEKLLNQIEEKAKEIKDKLED